MKRLSIALTAMAALFSCRSMPLLMDSDHRSRPAAPAPPDSTFLDQLSDVSSQSSRLVQAVDQVLAETSDWQNLRIRIEEAQPSVALNPLDLLRRILNELGVAHATNWQGQPGWFWESLGGRRLLGVEVRLVSLEGADGRSYQVVIDQSSHFTIAKDNGSKPKSFEVDLEQVSKLYQELNAKAIQVPVFNLEGTFELQLSDANFIIKAKNLAWASTKVQIKAESFVLAFSTSDRRLSSFLLLGKVHDRTGKKPDRGLHIEAQRRPEGMWELLFHET